ncbi:MAG: glycosyltransferase family 2 protein [Clostridia bacterium]|nr:glycosyltransferase family 2 protein [Clostridia bacterium]
MFPLYEAVRAAFDGIVPSYEFIFVDDGSYDGTGEKLRALTETAEVPVKAVRFSRNFGKEAAILAGLNAASGDCFTIMDGDLQQSPSVVVEMVQYLEDHPDCDCVTAFQENRHESPVMVFFKNGFYNIINRVADTEFVNGASDFRTFRNNVREAVLSLPEGARFSKGIFSWVGFDTHYIPYTAEERLSGTSKWSFLKLWRYALSGIISFTTVPLRLPFFFGFGTLAAAACAAVLGKSSNKRRVPVLLVVGSLPLFALGVLGEYIARVYQESKRRPVYLIKEVLDNRK